MSWRDDVLRSLERDGADAGLSWAQALPASRWSRLAAATLRAVEARPRVRPAAVWVPAAAMAVIAAFLLRVTPPAPKPALAPSAVPAEAIEKRELLEHLELLEDWDAIEALAREGAR